MAEEKKETKKVRKPSALKRDIQAERRRLKNKTYQSTVNSAIKSLNQSLSQKEVPASKEKLELVFSLMDKGVKKGIYKQNRASRVKSKLSKKVLAKA